MSSMDVREINHDCDEDPISTDSQPSVLKVIVEKFSSVESKQQTVSILKKEIASHELDSSSTGSTPVEPSISLDSSKDVYQSANKVEEPELNGLNDLLADSSVKTMIKSVAGPDTQNLISEALETINSSESIDDKRKALRTGIQLLHSNLRSKMGDIKNDPKFTIALGIAGITRHNIKLD